MSREDRISSLDRCAKEAPDVHVHFHAVRDEYAPCEHCWAAQKAKQDLCACCGRAEGCTDEYGGDAPMGPLVRCGGCHKLICVICEADGCSCFDEGAAA